MSKQDVLIIGGGLAGITTALELLDQNRQVTILDRDTEDKLGGLAQWSLGGIFLVNSPIQRKRGIKDSEELAHRDWWACAEFGEEDHLPETMGRTIHKQLHLRSLRMGKSKRNQIHSLCQLAGTGITYPRKFGTSISCGVGGWACAE